MSRRESIKLKVLRPIDIENCENVSDILNYMSQASFGGRSVGKAWSTLRNIVDDPNCALILTISGAMTVAKLGRIFGSLISRSIVKAVITTGAVVTHSFVEELGMNHYKVPIKLSDKELYALKLNRVYDSIEPESNLVALEKFACKVFSKLNPENGYGSFEIIRHLADEMIKGKKPDGFLGAANTHCVNVYVPALSDSELGLYLFRYSKHSKQSTKNNIIYDPFKDLSEYSRWLCRQKRIAFLTLGGGSPRNWGQQMLPFLKTQKKAGELHSKDNIPEVAAAIRICPDPAELGHLSGATYSEGITWGKFEAKNDDHFVEIQCDATIVFPILAKLLCDYVDQKANKR